MLVEQRIYTMVPGGVAEYVRLYAESGRAAQERVLGPMLGCYTREVGELNQLIYLWSFASMEDRSQRRARLMADEAFKVFRGQVRHLLVRQENSLLLPALPR
jgi:hypothetical protein